MARSEAAKIASAAEGREDGRRYFGVEAGRSGGGI
jgi:hypothetical protein